MSGEINVGLVGLDTSHAIEFAKLWHDASHPQHVAGARIGAAFAGGSPDWELSWARVDGFTARMRDNFGVAIKPTIEGVVAACDAVMILSVDGRVHRAQFEQVGASGKPVFIDKPLAMSVAEVDAMAALAKRSGTRVFSASSWRWAKGLAAARAALGGHCEQAKFAGPWPRFSGAQGWAFYGLHHIELLYAAMGAGCESVECVTRGNVETVTGYWPEERRGSFAEDQADGADFSGMLKRGETESKLTVTDTLLERYAALLREVVRFFRGGLAPVSWSETRETIAFMEAALRSRELGGKRIDLNRRG